MVNTASPQDSRPEEEPRAYTTDVDDAGSFVCRIPNCPRFVARLAVGTGSLWKVQFDPDVEPHDVDFGRIELGPTCCVRGQVLLLPAFLVLQPEVRLRRFGMDVAAPLDADGSFSIGPVPLQENPYFDFELALLDGDTLALRRAASTEEGDWAPWLREGADYVAPDLVPVTWTGAWLGGRVIDEAGDPVAFAQVRAGMVGEPEEQWNWYEVMTDRRGRFQIFVDVDEAERLRPWEIAVAARDFRQQHFRTESSSFTGFLWCEAKLSRESPLHGSLVDERGSPLVGWRVGFVETDEQLMARMKDRASIYVGWNSRLAYAITDALGEFDCCCLEVDMLRVYVDGPGGEHLSVDRVPVVAGSIALQYAEPDAAARTSR